jgi:hypothetical protein
VSYDRFLISDEIITLPAKFGDGTEADTYWKKCAHVDFERWREAETSDNPAKTERGKQQFIAACLVNQDGTRAISDKDSIKLTAEGVSILFPLALQSSGITKQADAGNALGEAPQSTSSDTSP